MKIAVLSDIHDNIVNLKKALEQLKGKVEVIIFCGDMIAPSTTELLASANLPTFLCLGNNDADLIGMQKMGGEKFTWTRVSEEYGEVELEGKKIAFIHYPKVAKLLAESGNYDAVFFGHTHEAGLGNHGKTLLLNPGALAGIRRNEVVPATYAIYDTATNEAEIIAL
jgi:hypothetical protein